MVGESPRGEIGEFIARIRAGDEEAAAELLRRYEAEGPASGPPAIAQAATFQV